MKFIEKFLVEYDESEYLRYTRAKLLLNFSLILIVLVVIIQFSMLTTGLHDFLKTLAVTPVIFFGMILGVLFLKKGKYETASKIVITVCSIAVIGGLIREPYMNPEYALTSYIYFVYPCMALCIIFSTTRFFGIICALFTVTVTALFLIMKSVVPDANMKQLIIFFMDTIFSFVFFYLIGLLISKIFTKNSELSEMESEKNRRNYNFIKQVLGENSAAIITSMQKMSSKSDLFSRNTHDLASSIEEITANIEQITAGIDNVSSTANVQYSDVASMRDKLIELSIIIQNTGMTINDSLEATREITSRAQKGEDSLRQMEKNMEKIRTSSHEMTNIAGIINDISDRINLLSLNAAIEAARAGEAGRGFAVVADEISKLAEGTASSIKDINSLINTNETETRDGMEVIRETVGIISSIVSGVDSVNERISRLVEYRDKQNEANSSVIGSIDDLEQRSEQITKAALEQKNGTAEILKHISEINSISLSNSSGAEDLHLDSEELYRQMNSFRNIIDEYRG